MTSVELILRLLPATAALVLFNASLPVMAQAKTEAAPPAKSAASEPSAYEKTKKATKKAAKSVAKAGGEAADATKKAGSKAGDAVTGVGEKINSKIPRTDAYKKQHANDKPDPKSGQATN